MITRTSSALLLLLTAIAANAQQYRWVDEHGRVHYSDTLPPPSARDVRERHFKGNAVGVQASYDLSRAMREAPVTLYTHPTCTNPCQLARDVLAKRGVPFQEVIAADAEKIDQLERVSGSTAVPVLVVGRQVETTVSAEAYNRALDVAGYPTAGVLPATRSSSGPENR